MKKLACLILFFILSSILIFSLKKNDSYRVLKVKNAYEFYVDYNQNNVADKDEYVTIDISNTDYYKLNEVDAAEIDYLSTDFAKKKLLNKNVKIYRNGTNATVMIDNYDYKSLLIQKGYLPVKNNKALVDNNLKYAKTLNLVSYNVKSHKYHKLDCEYAFSAADYVIIKFKDLPSSAQPCKHCHNKYFAKNKYQKHEKFKYPRDVCEKYLPIYKDKYLEFYVTDFTKYYYPSSKCLTTACMSLVREINSAKHNIDFAIYGTDNQPEVINALYRANNRGVKIRWVYDTDKHGKTIYLENFKLKKTLTEAKSDIEYNKNLILKNNKYKDAIMHNKFFIFDNAKVWTGSANISQTDLSGFNANSVILIKSRDIADIYEKEFEMMYDGYFHVYKNKTPENSVHLGASNISVWFSPKDKIIENKILPIIDNAHKYVYVPVFVVTDKSFVNALINAKNRGVDVKLIVDATSASNRYSAVKYLRANHVKLKTENRAGKMHMKSIVVDDRYLIVGSMNFTKSGERYNDENVLIIENPYMAKEFKKKFLYFWNTIPEKWLNKNPGAETFNSINACFDGIDNDFDGKTDMQDDSCNYKHKNVSKK